jgi:hypothetical protein
MRNALCHHPGPRQFAGQPHRLVAHRAAGLRRPLPPCNHQCPAGENIQGWLFHAESGALRGKPGAPDQDNPFPAIMGRVCYHTCEGACNRGQLDAAVGINSVERFLGDEAIKRGWKFEPQAAKTGKRVLVVGAGSVGPVGGLPPGRLGHAVTVHEAGPLPGGMMRFGIPKYRLPREVLDAEVQRIVDMGVTIELQHQGRQHLEAMQPAASTPCSWPSARTSPSAPSSRPAIRPRSSMRSRCCAAWRAKTSPCWAAASSSTAAATPPSTWRARPSAWAPPRPSSSTAARATRCRRTTSRSKRRCRKA